MDLVQVKGEPQELVELGDSDDDDDRYAMFDIDEEMNRSILERVRRRRNRRNAFVSSQPRFGPLANSLSPARFGAPTAAETSRLTICEDEEAELVQTKSDLAQAVLSSVQLARLRKYMGFEQLHELVAGNAFVRLFSGAQKKIDQIVGILCCDEPYECDVLGIKFDMRFQTLWSGVCRLTQIASQPAEEMTEKEFERWREEMQKRRLPFPTLESVTEKRADFTKALEQIGREHATEADYPTLRVRPDEEVDDLMPAGCFSETDEESDGTEEQQRTHPPPHASPTSSACAGPPRGARPAQRPPLLPDGLQTVDPVESAADVKGALLTRARLVALYTSNPFDQFERAVRGCFVRINMDNSGNKLDQLEMASETAMEQYTLKGNHQCRVILHLTLHGHRRINALAFSLPKTNTRADDEFREWHTLMAQRRLPLPSKRFVASKVAQLSAYSTEKEKPPPSLSNSGSKEQQQHRQDAFAAAHSLEENADKEQPIGDDADEDDDVQLMDEEDKEQRKLTSFDVRSITLTVGDLIELFGREPSPEKRRELLTGCFVRVFCHSGPDGGASVHQLNQIVNVQKGALYRLRTIYVDVHLTLRGESEPIRCDNVSNKMFTEEEFEEWAERTRNKDFPFPTKLFIDQKVEHLGRSNVNSSPGSPQRQQNESAPPTLKRRQSKKRALMELFRTDRGGEGKRERAVKGPEEKHNRTTTATTTPWGASCTDNSRRANNQYASRHNHSRPVSLFSMTTSPSSFYASPVSPTIRHHRQLVVDASSSNGDDRRENGWSRKTERFITHVGGIVDKSSSSSSPYRPGKVKAEERITVRLERATGNDGAWRRTQAPMGNRKQLRDVDEYVGHRPLSGSMSSVSMMGWSGNRKSGNGNGGYGNAPRAITPSASLAEAFDVASNSGVVPSFFSTPSAVPPSRHHSFSSTWAPNYINAILSSNNNENNNNVSAWPSVGYDNGNSSDDEPMVARARQQVMDNMEMVDVAGGGDGNSFGGAEMSCLLPPWHEKQQQKRQQQQTDNNFKLFEQCWYNNNDSRAPMRSTNHYSTPRSRSGLPHHQFFSAPSTASSSSSSHFFTSSSSSTAPRPHHISSSPPPPFRTSRGVPAPYFFATTNH